ncbi:MAG: ATP synthase F1 subunit delta [Candidatus Neomarinimicrobiota bacterium]
MRLDPKTSRYVRALYSVAERLKSQEEVLNSLNLVSTLLQENSQFKALLFTKRLKGEQKSAIIASVLGNSCHKIVSEFLGILADEGLIPQVRNIKKAFDRLQTQALGLVKVTARVSEKLSETRQQDLKKTLVKTLGKNIDLNVVLDPDLLGGIKLRIGNIFVDASIQNQMKTLRRELLT